MPRERTILVHLNVAVPADDDRTPAVIALAIGGAIEVGSEDDSIRDLSVVISGAEEI